MRKNKQEVITFKADEALLDAMRGIPNRSEFIRKAIVSALGSVCPSCRGTGYVSLDDKLAVERETNGKLHSNELRTLEPVFGSRSSY